MVDKIFGFPVKPLDFGYQIVFDSFSSVKFTEHELELLVQHNQEEFDILQDYVLNQISPWETRQTFNKGITSYRLKHIAEKACGFYVSEVFLRVMMGICRIQGKDISKPWTATKYKAGKLGPTNTIYRLSNDMLTHMQRTKTPYKPFGYGDS